MAFINSQRHIGMVGMQDPETLGGTETFYGSFKIHTFLTSGTFTVLGSQDVTCDVLSIAGGGGGGSNQGGGGAGGMVEQPTVTIAPGEYNVVVGNGGTQTTAGFDSTTGFGGVTTAVGGGWNNGAGGSGSGGGTSGQGGGAGTAVKEIMAAVDQIVVELLEAAAGAEPQLLELELLDLVVVQAVADVMVAVLVLGEMDQIILIELIRHKLTLEAAAAAEEIQVEMVVNPQAVLGAAECQAHRQVLLMVEKIKVVVVMVLVVVQIQAQVEGV